MEKINEKLKGNLGIFLFKILNDIFILLIIAFFLLLISEGIMPGLVGAYFSFTKIIFIFSSVLAGMIYLGKINKLGFESSKMRDKKNALFGALAIFFVLLTINSLLKFTWWEIGIITIVSTILLFYFYKNFSAES